MNHQHRLRVITNSELKTHRRCAREHHISYELGIRSAREDADALRFGTAIHRGLEAWWLADKNYDNRFACALAALPLELDPYELARAVEMLRGYDIRWGDEPLEVLRVDATRTMPLGSITGGVPLVEAEFRAALINPLTQATSRTFTLGGKLDVAVVDLTDGRAYVIEHKTSSDDITAGSRYWQLLQLDTQVSTYYAGLRSLGYEPAGVIYDVLGKPKLRPLQATPVDKRHYRKDTGQIYAGQRDADETPDEYQARLREAIAAAPDHYLVRGTVVRFDTEERDAQWDAWQQARMIREAELAKRWPRNPDACLRFGRLCSYFGVCTGTAQLEDPSEFRRVEHVHEELTTPDNEAPHDPTGTSNHGTTTNPTTHH